MKIQRIGHIFSTTIGVVSGILGIGQFVLGSTAYGGKIHLSLLLLVFITLASIILTWQSLHYPPRSRYSSALAPLQKIYSKIQALSLIKDSANITDIEHKCQSIVEDLATLFTERTGKKCSVCIKTVAVGRMETGGQNLEVITLCRDHTSEERQVRADSVLHHWIDKNTDFDQLFKSPSKKYFISNDLPSERDYKNTSFLAYGDGPPPSKVPLIRRWYWDLPYQSTIVAAISPIPSNSQQTEQVVGFLCVDSNDRHVFLEPYDGNIVKGIADSLYSIIVRYGELRTEGYKASTRRY